MPRTLTAGGAPGAKSAFNCCRTAVGHRGRISRASVFDDDPDASCG
jgi:hypothetical protein